MKKYVVGYLNGKSEKITATNFRPDGSGPFIIFWRGDKKHKFVNKNYVLSIEIPES